MLRAAAREWLADRYPVDRVVALADGDGWDPGVWTGAHRARLARPGPRACWSTRCWPRRPGTRCCRRRGSPRSRWPAPPSARPPSRPATLAWADDAAPDAAGRGQLGGLPRRRRRRRLAADRGQARGAGPRRSRRPRWSPPASTTGSTCSGSTSPTTRRPCTALSTEDRTRRLGELRLDGTPAERLEVDAGVALRDGPALGAGAAGLRGERDHPAGAGPRGRVREDPDPVRPADRLVPGGVVPAGERLHGARAGPLAGVPGGLVRGGGRPGAGRGGRLRGGGGGPGRGRRLRERDPVDGRYRLHLGPPAAPLLQAGAVDRRLRRLADPAPGRARRTWSWAELPTSERQPPEQSGHPAVDRRRHQPGRGHDRLVLPARAR